jgi:hypothetical protein
MSRCKVGVYEFSDSGFAVCKDKSTSGNVIPMNVGEVASQSGSSVHNYGGSECVGLIHDGS